jgi:hypothetical protein
MSATLLKIAKLIPRLASPTEAESLTALRLIERQLANENLTFVDAGLELEKFVRDVLKFSELPAPDPNPTPNSNPNPNSSPAFTRARTRTSAHTNPEPSPNPAHGPSTFTSARTSPSPPPNPAWSTIAKARWTAWQDDGSLDSHVADRCSLLLDAAKSGLITLTSKEQSFLSDLYFMATSGLKSVSTLTPKQREFFFTVSNKLP